MRISKQLLEHLKFLKESILLNNKQIGNHSREKENTYTKKEPTGNSRIEKNTSEISSLDGLTADWRTESVNLKTGQEMMNLKNTEERDLENEYGRSVPERTAGVCLQLGSWKQHIERMRKKRYLKKQ